MQNILGISLSTRLMGTAILYDGELSVFRVRTFYGAWNRQKRDNMIRTIKKTVEGHGIHMIALKIPKVPHRSQRIHDLVTDIRQISEELNIKLTICTISCLLKNNEDNKGGNKQDLVQAIIARYPNYNQLASFSAKDRNSGTAYHIKLFEAIVCAEMALRTGQ